MMFFRVRYVWVSFIMVSITSCSFHKARKFDFPEPVDTHTRPVEIQSSKIFPLIEGKLYASNQFPTARLNDVYLKDDSTLEAVIYPENTPINPSPWYAFKLWVDIPGKVEIRLTYPGFKHRYYPKISIDGTEWNLLDSLAIVDNTDSIFSFRLAIPADTVWIAAQEIWDSQRVRSWADSLDMHPYVDIHPIGKSKLGRPLWTMEIGDPGSNSDQCIVLLSRQHPPEVTGFLALRSFLDELLQDTLSARAFFNKYRLLVFPLMNPDGVDLGHWRHNAGGIDLNRDWAYYRQPETRVVANYITKYIQKQNLKVVAGLDFHSTYEDVFYTNVDSLAAAIPGFKDAWLTYLEEGIVDYEVNEKPSGLGRPVSKTWFSTQFGATGVTYEIGDETDRGFIDLKGRVSARAMVKALDIQQTGE